MRPRPRTFAFAAWTWEYVENSLYILVSICLQNFIFKLDLIPFEALLCFTPGSCATAPYLACKASSFWCQPLCRGSCSNLLFRYQRSCISASGSVCLFNRAILFVHTIDVIYCVWVTPLFSSSLDFPALLGVVIGEGDSWDVVRSLPVLGALTSPFSMLEDAILVSPVMPVAINSSSESVSLPDSNIDSKVFPVGKLPPSGIGSTTMGAAFCKLESLLGGLQSLVLVLPWRWTMSPLAFVGGCVVSFGVPLGLCVIGASALVVNTVYDLHLYSCW